MKIAFGVEYEGTGYRGWQRQAQVKSVQACVERALSKVADVKINTHCAGRTDSGVHASGQVIHIQTEVSREAHSWVFGTNANLPKDISITWMRPVAEDFHARFSATGRVYSYLICNRPVRPAILHNRVTWLCRPLDHRRMQEAGRQLIGKHDFSAYRGSGCQSHTPIRKVRRLDVVRSGDLVSIVIEANAFLLHMVRNIAGVLIEIGIGKASTDWAWEVLNSRDRTQGGATASPSGLYLCQVHYPEHYGIPAPDEFPLSYCDTGGAEAREQN